MNKYEILNNFLPRENGQPTYRVLENGKLIAFKVSYAIARTIVFNRIEEGDTCKEFMQPEQDGEVAFLNEYNFCNAYNEDPSPDLLSDDYAKVIRRINEMHEYAMQCLRKVSDNNFKTFTQKWEQYRVAIEAWEMLFTIAEALDQRMREMEME